MKGDNFISVKEAAEIMGISRMHIIRKIHSGQIPAIRVGRSFIIDKNNLGGIYKNITDKDKSDIEKAVKKTVTDYGDVLIKLGAE